MSLRLSAFAGAADESRGTSVIQLLLLLRHAADWAVIADARRYGGKYIRHSVKTKPRNL